MNVPPPHESPNLSETVIDPPGRWRWLPLAELWAYRDLGRVLAWRDVQVRYKQTVLGAAWAVFQPLVLMGLFALYFGRVASVPTGGVPYPLFAYAGLLPWFLFATAVSAAGNSVVDSERLVSKVYVPRLLIPLGAAGVAVIDFAIASGVLIVLMAAYGWSPAASLVLVPVAVGAIALTAIGVGSFLAAVNVKYRDFRHALPFLIQAWMFATPTVYLNLDAAGADVPGWLRTAADLNPLTGQIAFARAAVLGQPLPWADFAVGGAVGVVLFALGTIYFGRMEDEFADAI